MNVLDALEITLLLKKNFRNRLALIKKESELISFLNDIKIRPTSETILSFKAVIPSIYNLQNFINRIDNENNIKGVLRKNSGTVIKRLRNIPNFAQTMKNFDSSDFFIEFVRNRDIIIAIRYNENWNSPNKETLLNPPNTYTLTTFKDNLIKLKEFELAEIKKFLKKDNLEDSDIRKNNHLVNFKKFKWNFTFNNALEIFKGFYGFMANRSNNNGLYTIILEFNDKKFGNVLPIHELENIESNLTKLGIKKSNKNPTLWIDCINFTNNQFVCNLYCGKTILQKFFIQYSNDILLFKK